MTRHQLRQAGRFAASLLVYTALLGAALVAWWGLLVAAGRVLECFR
jgi:hypothetical protein